MCKCAVNRGRVACVTSDKEDIRQTLEPGVPFFNPVGVMLGITTMPATHVLHKERVSEISSSSSFLISEI